MSKEINFNDILANNLILNKKLNRIKIHKRFQKNSNLKMEFRHHNNLISSIILSKRYNLGETLFVYHLTLIYHSFDS